MFSGNKKNDKLTDDEASIYFKTIEDIAKMIGILYVWLEPLPPEIISDVIDSILKKLNYITPQSNSFHLEISEYLDDDQIEPHTEEAIRAIIGLNLLDLTINNIILGRGSFSIADSLSLIPLSIDIGKNYQETAISKIVEEDHRNAGEYIKNEVAPMVKSQLKLREVLRKGHESIHGTKDEKEARWLSYQIEVDRLQLEENLLYTAACETAAEKFKCSTKTIFRHTYDKTKKRKN